MTAFRIMATILGLMALTLTAYSHGGYTGYSGATGSSGKCASACHGSGTGSITLSGVPANYVPGTIYRIVVKHTAGSSIVNFNASTRIGSGSVIAGSFTAVTNAQVYSGGSETGVHSPNTSIDSAVFQWTAPSGGTGQVKFFVAGIQGSKNGANSAVTLTSNEAATSGIDGAAAPLAVAMVRNYPNPFNPATTIEFTVPAKGRAMLRVFNLVGQEVAQLFDNDAEPGVTYAVPFSGIGLSSGIYLTVLETGAQRITRKIVLAK
jgi:hypothetical protein